MIRFAVQQRASGTISYRFWRLRGVCFALIAHKNTGHHGPKGNPAMNAKYLALFPAFGFVCTLLAGPGARAESINADSYAIGTNVSNALPGVTLGYETYGDGTFESDGSYVDATLTKSPLVIGTGYPIENQNNLANTFGSHMTDVGTLSAPPPFQYPWSGLYAEFSSPIYNITINGFVSSGLPSILYAYGTSGNLIGTQLSSSYCLYYDSKITGDLTCFDTGTHISFTSTTPIASIIYGGYLDDGYATEIEIPGLIPEPGTLGLLAVGLIGLVLTARRRARSLR